MKQKTVWWIIFISIFVVFGGCKVQRTPIYIKEIQNLTDEIYLGYLFNNLIERELIKTFDIVSTPQKTRFSVWGALHDYKKIPLSFGENYQTQHYILSLSLTIHVQHNNTTESFKFTENINYTLNENINEIILQNQLLKQLVKQLELKLRKLVCYDAELQ